MQHLEVSGVPVLYIGRTVPKGIYYQYFVYNTSTYYDNLQHISVLHVSSSARNTFTRDAYDTYICRHKMELVYILQASLVTIFSLITTHVRPKRVRICNGTTKHTTLKYTQLGFLITDRRKLWNIFKALYTVYSTYAFVKRTC